MKPEYNFELKNVKYAAFSSEETHCFTATLYLNGKRFCTVDNDGRGGPNRYTPFNNYTDNELHDMISEINKELDKIKEPVSWDPNILMGRNLEIVVGELMNDYLTRLQLKRVLKKIAYFDPKDDGVYTMPASRKPTKANLELIKKAKWWNKDNILLNELPADKALEYLKKTG